MNACIKAVFAAILVAFCSIALIAVGQPITNTGGVTTQVVNPSLPEYLPIGSDQAILEWAVTNRQWYTPKTLLTFTAVFVFYTNTSGLRGYRALGLNYYKFESYKDFERKIGGFAMQLVEETIKDAAVDHSSPLSLYSYHSYRDQSASDVGAMGVSVWKDLGLDKDIRISDFKNYKVLGKQAVIRVPNLERFEVTVDDDTSYHYTWPSDKKSSEHTASDFIALQDWYSKGDYKARFKITAGGVTREYTQHGSQILPPKVTMTRATESSSVNIVSVDFTIGTETVVEVSNDLIHWCSPWIIPWDIGTDTVSIPYYIGSGSSGDEKVFFRAMSK
jgi:hypothetical protein